MQSTPLQMASGQSFVPCLNGVQLQLVTGDATPAVLETAKFFFQPVPCC
jgi:hypothetical protein